MAKNFLPWAPHPLIRVFKRNPEEEVIIGECELLATVLITLIWGMKATTSRILIVCADNLNVSHWLQNSGAKSGTAGRTLQALAGYLIENKIEVIPRYVRIGRNFSCDHLSRTDEEGIQYWSQCNHMTRVVLPSFWNTFCEQLEPGADFVSGDSCDIRSYLREHGRGLTRCERRTSAYTFVACIQRYQ